MEKQMNGQLSFEGLPPLRRTYSPHRQRELDRRRWRVANRKRVAKLLV